MCPFWTRFGHIEAHILPASHECLSKIGPFWSTFVKGDPYRTSNMRPQLANSYLFVPCTRVEYGENTFPSQKVPQRKVPSALGGWMPEIPVNRTLRQDNLRIHPCPRRVCAGQR
jgi:hypothetical protein